MRRARHGCQFGTVRGGLRWLGALVVVLSVVFVGAVNAGADPSAPERGASVGHPYRWGLVPMRGRHAAAPTSIGPNDMSYNGGNAGVGVTTGPPQVYLVFWGSQWGTESTNGSGYDTFTGDPQGVAPVLQAFFKGLGTSGETWSGVMTQYCEGVAIGTFTCPNSNAEHIGYPTGGALAGVWEDTSSAAPAAATGHQLAQEAENAATHFGNTTTASNRDAQYVIVSPTGTNPDNYETQGFCAWHDYTGDSFLDGGGAASGPAIAFTNLPYIPDAGAGCGAGFVNSPGALDGVTIVEGHEYAETITDQFPAGGWTVPSGANVGYEIGDLCAWNANPPDGAADITLSTGSFPVQPMWSNDYNGGAGGCLISHSIVTTVANVSSASGTYGGTTTLTATLASGGTGVAGRTVSFTLNGFSVGSAMTNGSGVAQLDNASLSGIVAGTYPSGVAASFGGDSSYAASNGSNPLAVGKADQAIQVTTGAPSSAVYGTDFTVAATGGGSGNSVTFGSSGACTNSGASFTMTSGTGTCTVTFDQAGNTNYNAAPQQTESVTAEKADQTIDVTTAAPASAAYTSGFSVDANAPGGAVSFSSAGVCTNTGPSFTMTSGTGTCTVRFDESGDDNYNAAPQVSESVTATKLDESITFATPAARTYGNPDFDPGATSSSGYAVSYGASGACSIVSGKVHLTGAGSCTVTASQTGDADYNAAPPVQQTFAVNKAALSIAASNRQKYYDQPLTLGTKAFTVSGLIGADSVSGVTLTSSGAAPNAVSGNYSIVPSNAVGSNLAENYTITFHNGTLQVLPVGIIGLNGVLVATKGGRIDGTAELVMSNRALSFGGVVLSGSATSTQGSVTVAKTASVGGSITAGTTASISGHVGGTVTQHSPSTALATPTVAVCPKYSAKTGIIGGKFSYSPSSGNLVVMSGAVRLANRTYCFHTVTIDRGATLQVSGPVTIELRGKLAGAGHIVNKTARPSNLRISTSYGGSNGVVIVGGSQAYMTILAPRTSVTVSGGSFFGTLLAKTVSLTGKLVFHANVH